jgi:phosphonate transport system substrate-binding protein
MISALGTAMVSTVALLGCGASATTSPDEPSEQADDAADAAGTEWPDPFVVAIIPSQERTELDPSDSVAMTTLEEELGLNIEYHLATSYAATIEAQRSGQAHMAQYGPFSYVLAHDSGVDLVPLVTAAEGADAQAGYHSVASVRADSDIDSLEDAAGKSVCFVDPASTSGFLFPSAGLLEAGIDPESDDIKPIMAGGHDASVLALVDGQCEIAFSTEGMATKQLIETGQLEKGAIKQIWESELIPSSPTALSASLPSELQEGIRDVYLNQVNVDALRAAGTCDESDEDGFCGLNNWGFVEVDDSVYDGVRAVCDVTKSDSCSSIEE